MVGVARQLPARQAWLLARLSRGPSDRGRLPGTVLEYVSTGPQRKRRQKPGSAGVATTCHEADDAPPSWTRGVDSV
jgi:hypothetical protein